jgi:hypothetical protein
MSGDTEDWRWETRNSPTSGREGVDLTATPGWVDEIWKLRGLVLYDNGRRPQFRKADGRFADRDPLDLLAYHVLGWCTGQLVGCIRFVPVAVPIPSFTECVLGRERFEELLVAINTTRSGTVDVGRWIVHPDFRRHRVALSLVGGCWSYIQRLGFQTAVATVGTRGRQDTILQRTGLISAPGFHPRTCDVMDDELRTMYAVIRSPANNFRGMVERMGGRLIPAPADEIPVRIKESA